MEILPEPEPTLLTPHIHTQILRASPPCVFCGAQPDTEGRVSTTEEQSSQTLTSKQADANGAAEPKSLWIY